MVYRLFNEHYIITGGLLATYDGNTLEFNRPVFDFILPLMKFRKISNYNAKKWKLASFKLETHKILL